MAETVKQSKEVRRKIGKVSVGAGSTSVGRGISENAIPPKIRFQKSHANEMVNANKSGNKPQNMASRILSGLLIFLFIAL